MVLQFDPDGSIELRESKAKNNEYQGYQYREDGSDRVPLIPAKFEAFSDILQFGSGHITKLHLLHLLQRNPLGVNEHSYTQSSDSQFQDGCSYKRRGGDAVPQHAHQS